MLFDRVRGAVYHAHPICIAEVLWLLGIRGNPRPVRSDHCLGPSAAGQSRQNQPAREELPPLAETSITAIRSYPAILPHLNLGTPLGTAWDVPEILSLDKATSISYRRFRVNHSPAFRSVLKLLQSAGNSRPPGRALQAIFQALGLPALVLCAVKLTMKGTLCLANWTIELPAHR